MIAFPLCNFYANSVPEEVYDDEALPSPLVEGGHTVLVEVDVHSDPDDTTPVATPTNTSSSRVSTTIMTSPKQQEEGDIEVEETNDETKLLLGQ